MVFINLILSICWRHRCNFIKTIIQYIINDILLESFVFWQNTWAIYLWYFYSNNYDFFFFSMLKIYLLKCCIKYNFNWKKYNFLRKLLTKSYTFFQAISIYYPRMLVLLLLLKNSVRLFYLHQLKADNYLFFL